MAVDFDRLVIGPTVQIFGDLVRFQNGEFFYETVGVFDEAYLELVPLGAGGPGMEEFALGSPGNITTVQPTLGVRLSQLAYCPKQSDTVVILTGKHAGKWFEVKEVRPDSHGHALILLNDYAGI